MSKTSSLDRLLGQLPAPRASAVLQARDRWLTAGLSPDKADLKAVALAKTLVARRSGQLRQQKGTPVARAAARYEAPMQAVILRAIARAQAAIPMAAVERALSTGALPLSLFDDAFEALERDLRG